MTKVGGFGICWILEVFVCDIFVFIFILFMVFFFIIVISCEIGEIVILVGKCVFKCGLE